MAGTSIVSRIFSRRFRVSVNDANAYGAVLSRSQDATLAHDADELIERLREVASRNYKALVDLAPSKLPLWKPISCTAISATNASDVTNASAGSQVLAPASSPPSGNSISTPPA